MEKEVDAATAFAQYASELRYADIPSEVREFTKTSILDSLGVTAAASTKGVGPRELVELVRDGGGKKESTILGYGDRVPSWMAALANGAMARALDYDDTLDDAQSHPSDTTVPAAIAVAQRLKANGKQLITAVTLGNDITCRILHSISRRPQGLELEAWFYTSLMGIFGATAACGKLLGLETEGIEDALGIALYQAAGTYQARYTPGYSKIWNMATGFPAMAAVVSALMAEKGITGAKHSFEGKTGFYNMYFGGHYNRVALLSDLGKRFENVEISFKPWPGIRYNHSYIDATLQLMREHNIIAQHIKRLTVFVAGWAETFCEPIEDRRSPANVLEAKRSLPYLVAVAATKGKVLIRDVTLEGIRDPASLQFAQKVTYKHDARFNAENRIGPAMVEIELMDGESYSKQLDIAYGHPQKPITWQDLTDKFRDCASYSEKPLSKESVEKAIDMVSHLEEVGDINQLIELLA
jgi:2-methylcitrate dehydratase PrpD